ncbi:hypothetical protein PYJP_12880 [Pyrofollis japonicus]|uniref:2-hydroxyacid dehydrogenase n=1 Tax=Pyrofollis japonicus TaxID=3060460 RepID=UPI00295A741F|nr:2-hydroxyacid dehydrogenase [Pyrofollis japonicus]BEP17936.1 hypothetical protein PYJP_12880 [Pyrofollis japonicus]
MVYDVVAYPRLPSAALHVLEGLRYQMFHYGEEDALREFLRRVGARVLIRVGLPVNRELLGEAKGLELVITRTSGLDGIDVGAAEEKGVCVTNQPEVIAEAVAEHALGLAIAAAKLLVAGHSYVVSGEWARQGWPRWWRPRLLYGRRLGLLGMGRIASLVAQKFRAALGVREIYYWSRRRKPELEVVLGARRLSLEELFERSEILVAALPCTDETRGLVTLDLLEKLPRNAIFVNVGRGCVVEEGALEKLLERRSDIRVALDVYEEEPVPPEHPLVNQYQGGDRAVFTPHIAGYSEESMIATAILAAMQARRYLEKGCVWNPATKNCKQCTDSPPTLDEAIRLARNMLQRDSKHLQRPPD